MASLNYRDRSGAAYSLSGSAYKNDVNGTKKLYIRTGTAPNAKETYGIATVESASKYSPLKMKVNGSTVRIGRKETRYTYSTNSNSKSQSTEVVNTIPDSSLDEHLTKTSSAPVAYLYETYTYNASKNSSTYNATGKGAPTYPYPAAGAAANSVYAETVTSIDPKRYTGYSCSNIQAYSRYYLTQSHTYTESYARSTNGSGDYYWGGKYGYSASAYQGGDGSSDTITTKAHYINGDYGTYAWSMSTEASGGNYYFYRTGTEPYAGEVIHNNFTYWARNHWIKARVSASGTQGSPYSGNYDRHYDDIGNYVSRTAIYATYTHYKYRVDWTSSGYETMNARVSRTSRLDRYSETTWCTYRTTSETKKTQNQVGPNYAYSGTNPTDSTKVSTTYGNMHGVANVCETYDRTERAYKSASNAVTEAYSATKSLTSPMENRISSSDTISWNYSSGTQSRNEYFSKKVSYTYTTNSRTITTVNNSAYTTADKTLVLGTHNFV